MLIHDATTRQAYAAAATQQAQISALSAAWDGANVSVQVLNGATLLRAVTLAPWLIVGASMACGAILADTAMAQGTPTRVLFRRGSTDIFEVTAGLSSSGAEITFAASMLDACALDFSGVVFNASASLPFDATWASGGTAGTYNSTTKTWTPAKDGSGRVYAASWAIVPASTVVLIAGSELTAIAASVAAAAPSWSTAQLGLVGLVNSYSGLVYDAFAGHGWFLGGGHTNGFNNGLYRWDTYKMAWSCAHLPSDRSTLDSAYLASTNSTFYQTSADAASADIAATTWSAVNGTFYDQLPDNTPTARHTYQAIVWDNMRSHVVMFCRRLWVFDTNVEEWTYRRAINDSSSGATSSSSGAVFDAEEVTATYDEVRDEVWACSNGSAGNRNGYRYAMDSGAWSATLTGWSWLNYIVYSCRNGRKWVHFSPGGGDAGFHQNGRLWVHDMDTQTNDVNGVDCQLGGGIDYTYFNYTGGERMPSIVWVPTLNRYWLTLYTSASEWELFEIDPTTTPYTLQKINVTGALPAFADLLRTKLSYDSNLNAVFFWSDGGSPSAVYRFP